MKLKLGNKKTLLNNNSVYINEAKRQKQDKKYAVSYLPRSYQHELFGKARLCLLLTV